MRVKHIICSIIIALCVLAVPNHIYASAQQTTDGAAQKIQAQILNGQGVNQNSLQDGYTASGAVLKEADSLKITSDTPAQGVYIIWETYPQNGYTMHYNAEVYSQNSGFFQEYIPLTPGASTDITIELNSSAKPVEISLYSEGTLPENVHYWQEAVQKADILILPTHADDEHLFFGGVMPTYLNMGNISVQVAYMVNHSTEPYRQQELLNALWEAGLRNYPIIGPFHDQYSSSLVHAKTIYNEQEVVDYLVGLYERFLPQVVVGHDFAGEYGHGAHMLFAEATMKAAEQTQVQPQKVYVHLYAENEIIMEVDTPLENYGGRTAFEVAQDAFAHHKSQVTYFEVEKDGEYDLRKFGLAFSLVPVDTGNDMLENITTYYMQEQIALEEMARIEAEEKAAQEAAQKEQEERLAQEERERELALEAQKMRNTYIVIAIAVGSAALLIVVVVLILLRKNKRRRRRRKRSFFR